MSTHSFCFALLPGKIICHPHYWNYHTCRERSKAWRITIVTGWAPVQCHENVIASFSTWLDSTTSTHSVRNWLLSDWNVYITAGIFFALVVIIHFSLSLTIQLIQCPHNFHVTSYLCIVMSHSRNFLYEIKEFLHNEEQFVSSFVKESREHYDHLLFFKHTSTPSKKRLFDASVNHTVAGFVKEVICMHDIHWFGYYRKHHCDCYYYPAFSTLPKRELSS